METTIHDVENWHYAGVLPERTDVELHDAVTVLEGVINGIMEGPRWKADDRDLMTQRTGFLIRLQMDIQILLNARYGCND